MQSYHDLRDYRSTHNKKEGALTSMLKSVSQCNRYAICFAAVILSSSQGFAQTLGSRRGIRGITRNGNRQPVPAARVLVHGFNGFRDRRVTADADGAFSVLDLSAGVYELRPSKVEFSEDPRTLVEIGDASKCQRRTCTRQFQPDEWPVSPPGTCSLPIRSRRVMQEGPLDGILLSSELFGSTMGGRAPAAALLKPMKSSCEQGL